MLYLTYFQLRLAIIALKGVLTKATEALKIVPVYSILLCLTGSDMLLSGVQFDLVDQPGEVCSNALVMEVSYGDQGCTFSLDVFITWRGGGGGGCFKHPDILFSVRSVLF